LVLPANAKYSGGTGEPNDPYQIATAADLIALGETPEDYDKHFILTADIDLDPNLPGRRVFTAAVIGSRAAVEPPLPTDFQGEPFTGVLDGSDHEIRNLVIVIPWSAEPYSQDDYVGLVAWVGEKGLVKDLGLANVRIDAGNAESVGGLAGENRGTILSCCASGHVASWGRVGGLVGGQYTGTITSCHSEGSVEGIQVGGLVGLLWTGTMSSCYSTARVEKGPQISDMIGTFEYAGGLVGRSYEATISCCYASGDVIGDVLAGGLVGTNGGMIRTCYSSGRVAGEHYAGGLVGSNGGNIISCYATGDVSGTWGVGGLAGSASGGIATSYSTGKRTAERSETHGTYIGGLVGLCYSASVCLSYWDMEASGLATSSTGEGRTTQQMMSLATFAGWGHHGEWTLEQGKDYPHLAWESHPGVLITDPARAYSGGTGDPNDPYLVQTAEDLICLGRSPGDWGAAFALVGDIDVRISPSELLRIGTSGLPFTGMFDGRAHTVRSLRIESPRESRSPSESVSNRVGLFGCVGPSGVVRYLHLGDVDVAGEDYVGGLVGSNEGTILACSVTGNITAPRRAGGVAGENKGTLASSCATCTVNADWIGGGLVAENRGTIRSCYAMGSVGDFRVGGLAGDNAEGTIIACYSTATVGTRAGYRGGLVGPLDAEYGVVTVSFWDTQKSGCLEKSAGTGLPTDQMQKADTYLSAGWDFVGETANGTEDIWWIDEGKDYPRLWWEQGDGASP
jgi:hypothetical protein